MLHNICICFCSGVCLEDGRCVLECKEMMSWSLKSIGMQTDAAGAQCKASITDGVQFVSQIYQIEDRDLVGLVL